MRLLLNIDVPDLAAAEAFYHAAFGFVATRRLGPGAVELGGAAVPVFLLEQPAGSCPAAGAGPRAYARHWTPLHLDIVVDDLDAAVARATAAGAVAESPAADAPYGRIAGFADPFGHGFCLIQFNERGYDAITA